MADEQTTDLSGVTADAALIAEVEKALNEQGGVETPAPAEAPAAAPSGAAPASPTGNAALDLGALNEMLRSQLGDNYRAASVDDIVKMVKSSRDKMYEVSEENAGRKRELERYSKHKQVLDALENPWMAQRVLAALHGRGALEGTEDGYIPVDMNDPAVNPAIGAINALRQEMAVKEFHESMNNLPAFVNPDMRREVAIECTARGRYGKQDIEEILWSKFGPQMREDARKEGAREVVEQLRKNASGVLPGGASGGVVADAEIDPTTLSPADQEKWLDEEVAKIGASDKYAEEWAKKSSGDNMNLW